MSLFQSKGLLEGTASPSNGLLEGTANLLISEKYSDLTIITQTRSFKVHRAVVCTQSKVLAAMSDSGFKETSTSTLRLEHDDPAAVERMIKFLYTGNYDQENDEFATDQNGEPSHDLTLMANALVYSIADKYDIDRLKAFARSRFNDGGCCEMWNCENFREVVTTVFDTTPDSDQGLRSDVVESCADHIDKALTSEMWNEFFAENGAIALEVFKFARQNSNAEIAMLLKALAEAKGV